MCVACVGARQPMIDSRSTHDRLGQLTHRRGSITDRRIDPRRSTSIRDRRVDPRRSAIDASTHVDPRQSASIHVDPRRSPSIHVDPRRSVINTSTHVDPRSTHVAVVPRYQLINHCPLLRAVTGAPPQILLQYIGLYIIWKEIPKCL